MNTGYMYALVFTLVWCVISWQNTKFIAYFPLQYSSIFLIIIILFLYGYVQPYKSMISNVLEIVLAIDVLIMLALKNSNQIPAAILSQQPNDTVSAINNCTDINNVTGISPLVAALTPFYYIPMCVTLVGGAMWMCRKLHRYAYKK